MPAANDSSYSQRFKDVYSSCSDYFASDEFRGPLDGIIWQLEKFDTYTVKRGECIKSAVFTLRTDAGEWYLSLYPRGTEDDTCMSVYLHRESHLKLDTIKVDFGISILGHDKEVHSKLFYKNRLFKQGSTVCCGRFQNLEEIREGNEILNSGTLTLLIKMWKSESKEKNGLIPNQFCFLTSRVATYAVSFKKWIDGIGKKDFEYVLNFDEDPLRTRRCNIHVHLYPFDVPCPFPYDTECTKVFVLFNKISGEGRHSLVQGEISCENYGTKLTIPFRETSPSGCCKSGEKIWALWCVMDNSISLKCDFLFSDGEIVTEDPLYIFASSDLCDTESYFFFDSSSPVKKTNPSKGPHKKKTNSSGTPLVVPRTDRVASVTVSNKGRRLNPKTRRKLLDELNRKGSIGSDFALFLYFVISIISLSYVFATCLGLFLPPQTANPSALNNIANWNRLLVLQYVEALEDPQLVNAVRTYTIGGFSLHVSNPSHDLGLKSMRERSLEYLQSHLTLKNVWAVLALADEFEDDSLRTSAEAFIGNHSNETVFSRDWNIFVQETIQFAGETLRRNLLKELQRDKN